MPRVESMVMLCKLLLQEDITRLCRFCWRMELMLRLKVDNMAMLCWLLRGRSPPGHKSASEAIFGALIKHRSWLNKGEFRVNDDTKGTKQAPTRSKRASMCSAWQRPQATGGFFFSFFESYGYEKDRNPRPEQYF